MSCVCSVFFKRWIDATRNLQYWAQDRYKSWAVVNMVISHQVASNVDNILTI